MVGFFIRGEDEKVIHIDDKPSFHDHVSEGVVHELLVCGWGVCESEEHNHWFKKSFVGDEGSFPLMAICDSDVVITPSDVKLGK